MASSLVNKARIVRSRLRNFVRIFLNYFYDLNRFWKSSGLSGEWGEENLYARITMDYHRIEKGLALRNPRLGFGSDVIERLLSMVPHYEGRYGAALPTKAARVALQEYMEFHSAKDMRFPKLEGFLSGRSLEVDELDTAGTLMVKREAIHRQSGIDFLGFANSRFSVRQFSGERVAVESIECAILAALKSPSVCNRQTARVHFFQAAELVEKILGFQNGNRGFGEQAGGLLVVTSDMRGFVSVGERNQCWIDGGIFSMSLVYALHALGIGSCMLNWSAEYPRDKALRRAANIPDSEAVIMMIAVGHMLDEFSVARSPRRAVSDVLRSYV